jgi:hypothetical protein
VLQREEVLVCCPERGEPGGDVEVYAMVDALDDVGSVIERAQPERFAQLYRQIDLCVR